MQPSEMTTATPEQHSYVQAIIPLSKIEHRDQVRRDWRHDDGAEKLSGLTESVKEHGVLQPLIVTPVEGSDHYRLVVGHRRRVAMERAGEAYAPCLIRATGDRDIPLLQLIENIQRHNLSLLDEAQAMADIMARDGLSVNALAKKLGVTHTYVRGRIRILNDTVMREAVRRGLIAHSSAEQLLAMPSEYAAPLRAMLQRGESVKRADVTAAVRRQQADGYVNPRSSTGLLAGYSKAEVSAQAEVKREQARALRRQGRSYGEIADQLGVNVTTAFGYCKGAPDMPVVTTPHRRPVVPVSPVVAPAPSISYTVDASGVVVSAAPTPPPDAALSDAAPVIAPAPPTKDPDVTRLRFMLEGAGDPCLNLLASVLRVGKEKGWSCVELGRRVDQALAALAEKRAT